MNKYADIINLDRPISSHQKMPIEKRASIFSPFAALTGFKEKINDVEKYKDNRIYLSEDSINNLDLKFKELNKDLNRMVSITYYKNDNYVTIKTLIKKIDNIDRMIILENKDKIYFNDIIDIKL